MNFKDVIKKELLFETKKEVAGALKVFYDIDIKISEEDIQPEQQAPETQVPEPVPVAPVATLPVEPAPVTPVPVAPALPVQESINESEEVTKKIEGVVSLTKEDADNIQTIEDLIDFLGDKKHKGENILDELTVEVIISLLGSQDALKANDIIKKNDQIIINLAYGYKKDNSVGFKILKRKGVSSVSLIMLKDNEILDSTFDQKKFNTQIVEFRNEWLNK